MLARIGYNLLQACVVLAFAPLVGGVASRLKEILQSKRGPSIFQPYRRTAIVRNHTTIHIVDRRVLSPPGERLCSLAGVIRKTHVGHLNANAGYMLLAMLPVLVLGAGIFHH
jgi:hypothetical protein